MPRKSRIQSGTGVYHVMMRGINRQRIFEDTEDHYTLLQCLSDGQQMQRLDKEQRNAILSVSLCPIHSRSKTVQNQWISRRFRSFPFKLVQRFYGRTSKHPQDVRPYPLRTYVHRPFERTSTAPLLVRYKTTIKST